MRTRLADVTAGLRQSETTKAQLESEVAELREAAGAATDAARQNLIAVENQIRQLNEALGALGPAVARKPILRFSESGAPPERNQADGGDAPPRRRSRMSRRRPRRSNLNRAAPMPICSGSRPRARSIRMTERPIRWSPTCRWRRGCRSRGCSSTCRASWTNGLITTVPGELLFALGSDEVQAGAYDTLAKVAELIGTYDDRQVLIVGHSDAMGDAAYNRQLSERRAELVKQFFIDNFELGADLSTEGVGEARPIASNATPQGGAPIAAWRF